MSKEKKPSIYADRSTIGSADELDEYGVWVKSEPVDYSAAVPSVPSEVFPDDAPDLDGQSDSDLGFDPSADLDFPVVLDELPNFDDSDSDPETIPDISDGEADAEDPILADLDDFEFPDDTDEENLALADLDEITDFDTAESEAENTDPGEPDFTEIGLDELAGPDVLAGLSEESDDENPDEEPESFSIDIEDDSSDVQFMDDSEKKDELTVAFDDDDSTPLEAVADEAPQEAAAQIPETADHIELSKLPTQLLMKIAEELASIRLELANLKTDFAGIKTETPAEEPEHEHNFFVEEEDEKIALTGDELNNILNTAEFTEETGTDAAAGEIALAGEEQQTSNTESETFSINDLDSGLDLNMDIIEEKALEEPAAELAEEIPDGPVAEDDIAELDSFDLGIDDDSLIDEVVIESPSIFDIPEELPGPEDLFPAEESPEAEESSEAEEPAAKEDSGDEIFEDAAALEDNDFSDDFTIELDEDTPAEEEPSEESDTLFSFEGLTLPEEENPPEDNLYTEDLELPAIEDLVEEAPAEPDEIALDGDLDLPDFELEAGEELLELTEKGALPMTHAPEPEDTEYLLEQDPLVMEDFDSINDGEGNEAAIDLSGAVIDEPDLSLDIQDNPVEEPSLENLSIELEQEEPLAAEDEEFGIDEIPETDEQEEIEISRENAADDTEEDLALIPEGYAAVEEEAPAEKEPDEEDEEEEEEITEIFPAASEEEFETADEDAEEVFDIDENETEEAESPEAEHYAATGPGIPTHLKQELKTVLSYMDRLLESLPDEKIEEFAKSDYFETYKKLFKELGLV